MFVAGLSFDAIGPRTSEREKTKEPRKTNWPSGRSQGVGMVPPHPPPTPARPIGVIDGAAADQSRMQMRPRPAAPQKRKTTLGTDNNNNNNNNIDKKPRRPDRERRDNHTKKTNQIIAWFLWTWIWLRFTGFYLVSLGLTVFYLVLPGFRCFFFSSWEGKMWPAGPSRRCCPIERSDWVGRKGLR